MQWRPSSSKTGWLSLLRWLEQQTAGGCSKTLRDRQDPLHTPSVFPLISLSPSPSLPQMKKRRLKAITFPILSILSALSPFCDPVAPALVTLCCSLCPSLLLPCSYQKHWWHDGRKSAFDESAQYNQLIITKRKGCSIWFTGEKYQQNVKDCFNWMPKAGGKLFSLLNSILPQNIYKQYLYTWKLPLNNLDNPQWPV